MVDLLYRRPQKPSPLPSSVEAKDIGDDITPPSSPSSRGHPEKIQIAGIPESLSFERIMEGGTCPPVGVRDFLQYLLYIEHAAENLQFWLWIRDYEKRFSELSNVDKALSPEWTKEKASAYNAEEPMSPPPGMKHSRASGIAKEIFKESTYLAPANNVIAKETGGHNPFDTPPTTPATSGEKGSETSPGWAGSDVSQAGEKLPSNYKEAAQEAFTAVDLKWQPFTVQPFREEVTRVIALYIADGSPRELNISARDRATVLHALENTTHPSAFQLLKNSTEWSLRCQSHPGFVRWSICNGNRPRVIFARGLGVATIMLGLLAGVLLTLSSAGRGWRALAAIGLLIGISTLIAAWKGMCVVLHGLHARNLRPWELFPSEETASVTDFDLEMKKQSMETISSAANSYESEPWVAKYDKRNIIRKVFDRQTWIEEPALRQIQDIIFLQSVLGATVITAIIVGIFVALPKGRYY